MAIALAKVLQANSILGTLFWDGNNTSAVGFKKFLYGLRKSTSLKRMPLPVHDIGNVKMEKASETVFDSWHKVLFEIQVTKVGTDFIALRYGKQQS